MRLLLRLASAEDAPVIWEMQKIAFRELLERYQDYDTSPANQSLDQLRLRCSQKDRYYYFIDVDGNPVGVLSVTDKQDGSRKRLSPMFILPQFQGRGYAQEAIRQAEKIHGERGWELDTILQEERLVHLYEKMGYRKTGKTAAVNPRMTLVFYSHKRLSPMDTKKEKPSDFMIEIRRLFARCIELTGKPDCKPGFPIFPFARLDCLNDPSGACLFSTELATGVFQTGTLRLGLLTRFDLKRNRIGLILFNLIFL